MRFRLETLLKVRRAKEDERKRIVGERLRHIEALHAQKASIEAQIVEQTESMRSALSTTGQTTDVDFLRWGRHWMTRLRMGILRVDAEIALHRARLAQERAQLAGARKETKILERLKERQFEAARAEEAARERRESDDMNTARFVHEALHAADDSWASDSTL